MGGPVVMFLGVAVGVAVVGVIYRRLRARSLPTIPDDNFINEFRARHPINAAPEAILSERTRIARALGLAPRKLGVDQSMEFLSSRLSYLADFSVAWNDLADEAAEAREARGLGRRERAPLTVGELIEDRVT
jgi:hypothetical protein